MKFRCKIYSVFVSFDELSRRRNESKPSPKFEPTLGNFVITRPILPAKLRTFLLGKENSQNENLKMRQNRKGALSALRVFWLCGRRRVFLVPKMPVFCATARRKFPKIFAEIFAARRKLPAQRRRFREQPPPTVIAWSIPFERVRLFPAAQPGNVNPAQPAAEISAAGGWLRFPFSFAAWFRFNARRPRLAGWRPIARLVEFQPENRATRRQPAASAKKNGNRGTCPRFPLR